MYLPIFIYAKEQIHFSTNSTCTNSREKLSFETLAITPLRYMDRQGCVETTNFV